MSHLFNVISKGVIKSLYKYCCSLYQSRFTKSGTTFLIGMNNIEQNEPRRHFVFEKDQSLVSISPTTNIEQI